MKARNPCQSCTALDRDLTNGICKQCQFNRETNRHNLTLQANNLRYHIEQMQPTADYLYENNKTAEAESYMIEVSEAKERLAELEAQIDPPTKASPQAKS